MRLPRVRFTVRRVMVAIAVAAITMAGLNELLVRRPARRTLEARIAHHESMAAHWAAFAGLIEQGDTRYLHLRDECRQLSEWHARRSEALRRGQATVVRRFTDDPEVEREPIRDVLRREVRSYRNDRP